METGTIYIATNKENGKQYVGQTMHSFDRRLKDHIKEKRNRPFSNALRKYGKERFEFQQIIYKRDDLNYWEKYFIEKLNTLHPGGYNHTTGGNNFTMSAAAVEKLKAVFTEEVRKKIADRTRGKKYALGCRHTPEQNANKSKRLKGHPRSPEVRAYMKSEEYRQKISGIAKARGYGKWMVGKKATEETRVLVSKNSAEYWRREGKKEQFSEYAKTHGFGKWAKGKKQSAESIAKRVTSNTGKKRTEETKLRMREAQQKRRLQELEFRK